MHSRWVSEWAGKAAFVIIAIIAALIAVSPFAALFDLAAGGFLHRIGLESPSFDWGGLSGAIIGLAGLAFFTFRQINAQKEMVQKQLDHGREELNETRRQFELQRRDAAWGPAVEVCEKVRDNWIGFWEVLQTASGQAGLADIRFTEGRAGKPVPFPSRDAIECCGRAYDAMLMARDIFPMTLSDIATIGRYDTDCGRQLAEFSSLLQWHVGVSFAWGNPKIFLGWQRDYPAEDDDILSPRFHQVYDEAVSFQRYAKNVHDRMLDLIGHAGDITESFAEICRTDVQTMFLGRINIWLDPARTTALRDRLRAAGAYRSI